eukprot:366384-Chlamydomonas_euryale.AAC.8
MVEGVHRLESAIRAAVADARRRMNGMARRGRHATEAFSWAATGVCETNSGAATAPLFED